MTLPDPTLLPRRRRPFFPDVEPIRYAGPDADAPLAFRRYDAGLGRAIGGGPGLPELEKRVLDGGLDPKPRSGRQGMLENRLWRFV